MRRELLTQLKIVQSDGLIFRLGAFAVSQTVGKMFKEWMLASDKTINTANAYFSGVNTVSNHLGRDVYGINDVAELGGLYKLYGPGGAHADIGASNSNNVQNGLKQWLEYQRFTARVSLAVSIVDPVEGLKQWDGFLAKWPVSKLRELTLDQFYGAEGDDSFFSWLRDHTQKLGRFNEGALSSGVRPRGRNAKTLAGPDTKTDGPYIWYSILGDSAQEAFERLKGELLDAVTAVQCGDLSLMAKLKAAPGAMVWKVAFLYQNREKPLVLPFYTQKQIKRVSKISVGTVLQLQQKLMEQRGTRDLLEFAAELDRLTLSAQVAGEDDEECEDDQAMTNTSIALNQILFGPPGTGKTYSTINHALAILAPELLVECPGEDAATRKRLKDRYDELVKEDRVRFATFHQSFSYEDFVEGLRADSDGESGQIEYRVEPGVFKQLCDDARTSGAQVGNGIRANPRIWKISINGTGPSATKTYCLEHGEARIGWGQTGDLRESSEPNGYYEALGSGDKGTLSYFAEQMAVGDILLCIHSADLIGSIGVVTGDYRYETQAPSGIISYYQHVRPVRWLYREINLSILPLNDGRQFTLKTVYAMSRFSWADLLAYLQQQDIQPLESAALSAVERKPYVLVIDEINRGNVSRIFGELITLIEPSKREGADEALSVKLPYSKKPFSVPDNVYLIGTMNTADRSLAGLDIALRRRFSFFEMPPRPDLLDGVMVEQSIDVGQLLRVMNQRIEVLLDREHCLGHAYFMPLKTEATLERLALIFRNQVLPLLQEYFFEDWQRIQWVLNDHRKSGADRFIYQQSNNVQALFGADVNVGLGGQTWHVSEDAFDRLEAYLGVIDQQLPSDLSVIRREAVHGGLTLREQSSGSIEVWREGALQVPSKPLLRSVAEALGVSLFNAKGSQLNTRALGRQLINRLLEPA